MPELDSYAHVFKFRSGTHGLNEELGRQRGRKANWIVHVFCVVLGVRVSCGGSVQLIVVIWLLRLSSFVVKLEELFADSSILVEKTSYVQGSKH